MSHYGAPVGSSSQQHHPQQQGFVAPPNWDDSQTDRHRSGSQHASQTGLQNSSHHGLVSESERKVVKVRLGSDIRRLPLNNEDLNYDEFIIMMQRIFKGKLSNSDEVVVKYKDEDGDLITIVDDADLSFAMQNQKTLKVELHVNGDTGSQNSSRVGTSDHHDSSGFSHAISELQAKLSALPASLEQGFHQVLEKLKETSHLTGSSNADGASQPNKHARTGHEQQVGDHAHSAAAAKSASKLPGTASVENGFDELHSRTSSDAQFGHGGQQHRRDGDIEQNLGLQETVQHKEAPQLSHQQQQHPSQPPHQPASLPGQPGAHPHQQQQPQQPQYGQPQQQQQQQAHPGQQQFQHTQGQQGFNPTQFQQHQLPQQQQTQQGMGTQLKAQYSFPPPPGGAQPPQQQQQMQLGQGQQGFQAGPPRGPTPSQLPPSATPPVGPPPMMGQYPGGPGAFSRPQAPPPSGQPGQFQPNMFAQQQAPPAGYGFPQQAGYGMPPK